MIEIVNGTHEEQIIKLLQMVYPITISRLMAKIAKIRTLVIMLKKYAGSKPGIIKSTRKTIMYGTNSNSLTFHGCPEFPDINFPSH